MWLTYELTLNTSTVIMRLVCLEIIFFWGHWGEAHWPWPRGGPHHPAADHLWQPEGVCQDPAKRGDTAQYERAAERHPVIQRNSGINISCKIIIGLLKHASKLKIIGGRQLLEEEWQNAWENDVFVLLPGFNVPCIVLLMTVYFTCPTLIVMNLNSWIVYKLRLQVKIFTPDSDNTPTTCNECKLKISQQFCFLISK